jgi:hypothetical protein
MVAGFTTSFAVSALSVVAVMLDLYSTSSLKQGSTVIHIAPLGHIIMIPRQPAWKKRFHQLFLEIRLIGQNKNELPVVYMLCRWDRFPNIIVLFK